MSKLEETILSTTPLKLIYYKCFIDDIFILWPHPIADLNKFIFALNNYHPLIKFSLEHDYDKITFLDVNIFKGPNFEATNKLDVETHIKPTNRQAYVHADSFHPPGTSQGVAIGEMKHHLRTNSQAESFYAFKHKHRHNLLKRGYSQWRIQGGAMGAVAPPSAKSSSVYAVIISVANDDRLVTG